MSRSPRCNKQPHEFKKAEPLHQRTWLPPPAVERADQRTVVLAGLALLLVLGVVVSLGQVLPVEGVGLADGGVREEASPGYMTQATDAATDAIARPMPKNPLPGQKKPPCGRDETTINGACWVAMERRPGRDQCGEIGYEHDGRCFMGVLPAPKPDVSLGQ